MTMSGNATKLQKRAAATQAYDGEVRCTWCESDKTKLVSPYGPSVAEMMFKCMDCGQSFGWMKWEHRLPGGER